MLNTGAKGKISVSTNTSTYFLEMLHDLEDVDLHLGDIIFKWESVFNQSYDYSIKLAKQMFSEFKYPSIKEVYKISKYRKTIQKIQKDTRQQN